MRATRQQNQPLPLSLSLPLPLLVYLLTSTLIMPGALCQEIVFSFHCPFYRVTGDSKAGRNTSATCEVWACPGQTIAVSLCEESVGDTYIRLYLDSTELGSSDDSCGVLYGGSRLSYTFPYNETSSCQSFDLYQGCFDPNMCYGTTYVDIRGVGYGHPTSQPSGWPSAGPTLVPTSPSSEPSAVPTMEPTGFPTCEPSGEPSAEPTSEPTSPSSQPTAEPSVQPSNQPSSEPSAVPTCPSGEPSSLPTDQPTGAPTTLGFHMRCPEFNVVGDNVARSNQTVACDIWACPAQWVYINLCSHSSGDTYLRLFDGVKEKTVSDDGCGVRYGASKMVFFVDEAIGSPCRYYTLVQGCYDEVRCYGVTHIRISGSGNPTSLPSGQPSGEPSAGPTSPSGQPSAQPSDQPSAIPTSPTGEPSGDPSGQPSSEPSPVPSNQPTGCPSVDNTTFPPTLKPSRGPKPNMTTTIIIAVATPASVLVALAFTIIIYRYLRERYSVYLDVNSRVKCISSLKYHDDFDELDLFADGDYRDLCQGVQMR